MDQGKKISAVNRIISGKVYLNIDDSIYSISNPNKDQMAMAEMVYLEALNDTRFSDLITRDQADKYLLDRGIWSPSNDKELEKLNEYLDTQKIELYENLYNDRKKRQLRSKIKSIKNGINKSIIKKFSLDHMTLEAHAENCRSDFLSAICIRSETNEQVYSYNNWGKSDNYILQRFLTFATQNVLNAEEYREICRTEPFRSCWSISKASCFGVCPSELSNDQKNLIMYSRMYDNVYENPERPSDEVIEDDDMLDGWFAKLRRDAEKERKQREVDSILNNKGVKGGKGETFVVANSRAEADKIRGINGINERMKMRQREATVKQKGRTEEQNLPDVKLELRSEAMKQMADRFK